MLVSGEVMAHLPCVFVETVRKCPVADEALQCGGSIESIISELDVEKNGLERSRLLRIESNLGLTGLADFVEDIFFVGIFAHLLNEERGVAKGAPRERAQEFDQNALALEQALTCDLPEVIAR